MTILDPASTYIDDTVTIGAGHRAAIRSVVIEGADGDRRRVRDRGRLPRDATRRSATRSLLKPYCVLATPSIEEAATSSAPSATCGRWRTSAPKAQGRQLRGAEEVADRARVEGAAPLLRRRRDRGRGREHRRRHDHLQLRRRRQARDQDRRRRLHRAPTRAWWRPITIGEGAYIGAGSTITKDVPPDALAVARGHRRRQGRLGRRAEQKRQASPRSTRKQAMCGIVGYVGDKGAVGIIVDGLKRLEYRGYDSAGIAVLSDGRPAGAARRRADQEPRGRPARASRSRAASASATRAGPPTAGPPRRTPIRTPTAPARSSSSTTGSSRTTSRSRSACRPRATSSSRRPTPRSSPT